MLSSIVLSFCTFLLVSTSESASNDGVNNSTVVCPDGKFECFGDMTCCPLAGNDYGCCPYPDATCCADLLHCCPADTTCDIVHGLCRRGDGDIIPFAANIKAAPRSTPQTPLVMSSDEDNEILHEVNTQVKQVCPGGKQTCADGYTCCESPYGDYGCCPIKDAVCCSDKIHCCPRGSECNTKQGRCDRKVSSNAKNVICPGGEYQCPDYTTCCLMPGGQYGCCPLQNASCCPDRLHCCPAGYKCSSSGMCYLANAPWITTKLDTIPAVTIN